MPEVSERDTIFLKVHNCEFLKKDNLPDGKLWLLPSLLKVEIQILIFYSHFWPHCNSIFRLYNWFINFTGIAVYRYHFYNSIKKINYLSRLRDKAEKECDIDLLEKINSGNLDLYSSYQQFITCRQVSYEEAKDKYPDLISKLECKLRNSYSLYKNDDLSSFKWFVDSTNIEYSELVMKKGTKLSMREKCDA